MKTWIAVLAGAGVIAGAAWFALPRGSAQVQTAQPHALSERGAYWQEKIHALGPKEAYEAFAAEVAPLSPGAQHNEAHAFGGALFAEAGADGLPTCDARFSYGCFHQFLGDAIATLGVESIPILNEGCFKTLVRSPLSCQHGIGHGALAHFGYDDAALNKALGICAHLEYADPIGGCYGGVFMEYNLRTMLGDDATGREYQADTFAPCDALEGAFVVPCIYWQPQWWMVAVLPDKSPVEQYAAMGDYCRAFGTTPELLRACFEGVGNMASPESNFDPAGVKELCDAAGDTPRERLFCRSIGANHLGVDVGDAAAAEACADLDGASREYCMAYARNELNILVVGEPPV